jgi:5-methylcytosine-specific restriction protein A
MGSGLRQRREKEALMPFRAARPCTKPGCPQLVRGSSSRCPAHERERDAARGTSTARGYGADWRKLRDAFLVEHPRCEEPGCRKAATDVDHVQAHRGNEALRLDPNNLRAYCHSHHSSKTVREDGGLGRMPNV